MDRIIHHPDLSDERRMLLETLAGHFALLKIANPRKADSKPAKRAQRYIARALRETQRRRAA